MSSGILGSTGTRTPGLFTEEDGKGTRKTGVIIEPFPYRTERREFGTGVIERWNPKPGQTEGDPKMQIVVTLQTDERVDDEDTGARRLYLKGRKTDLHDKVEAALAAAVAGTDIDDFELGATLTVTRIGKGQAQQVGGPRPWIHEVEYVRPQARSGIGGDGGNRKSDTVLDRSQARSAAAKAAKPVEDDVEPPF